MFSIFYAGVFSNYVSDHNATACNFRSTDALQRDKKISKKINLYNSTCGIRQQLADKKYMGVQDQVILKIIL